MFEMERMRGSVAAEVRAQMARKKVSATAISEATGIPTATLSRKLNALSGFSLDDLFKVCDALEVSAADVIRDAAEPPKQAVGL